MTDKKPNWKIFSPNDRPAKYVGWDETGMEYWGNPLTGRAEPMTICWEPETGRLSDDPFYGTKPHPGPGPNPKNRPGWKVDWNVREIRLKKRIPTRPISPLMKVAAILTVVIRLFTGRPK